MKLLLEKWERFLESYGDELFVHGDGETEENKDFSENLVWSLLHFTRNSTVPIKKKLLPLLRKLADEMKKGKLDQYLKELEPPPGPVYRGRIGVTLEQAEKEGLFSGTGGLPDKLKHGETYKLRGGTFTPRPDDITSWTVDLETANEFSRFALAVATAKNKVKALVEEGKPFFEILMESNSQEPGFMLNYEKVKILDNVAEGEVLYIGGKLPLKGVTATYFDPAKTKLKYAWQMGRNELEKIKQLREHSEPYQKAVRKGHEQAKKELIGLGDEETEAGGGPFKKKPSMKRSKSAPPAAGPMTSPLEEGISQVVYHFTSTDALANILKTNRFMTSVAYGTPADMAANKKKLYYFSLARSMRSTYAKEGRGAAVIKLDGRKLGNNYKGSPMDYWGPGWSTDEMEDRIFTDKPYIEPASRYIEEIGVSMPLFDYGGKRPQTYTDRNIEWVRTIQEEGKKLGIPVYIYYDSAGYRSQRKEKGLTSVDEWIKMFEKIGGETDEWSYTREPRDPYYLAPFVEILNKIYFGDGTKDDLSEEGQKLWGNMKYYSDSNRQIVADIHNSKSDPHARSFIVAIGKAMRKEKMDSIEDLINAVREKIK